MTTVGKQKIVECIFYFLLLFEKGGIAIVSNLPYWILIALTFTSEITTPLLSRSLLLLHWQMKQKRFCCIFLVLVHVETLRIDHKKDAKLVNLLSTVRHKLSFLSPFFAVEKDFLYDKHMNHKSLWGTENTENVLW